MNDVYDLKQLLYICNVCLIFQGDTDFTDMALEEKSLDEVCFWLEDQGFDEAVVQNFKG